MRRLKDIAALCIISFFLVFFANQILATKSFGQNNVKEPTAISEGNNAVKGSDIKGASDEDILEKGASITAEASALDQNKDDPTKDEEQEIMEKSLELLNSSRSFWEKGDLENALDLLDQAYALLLETNGNPDIARQKDDLRLLIAKNILAIYTSMQTATNGKRSEIPLVINNDVQREIQSFQNGERDFFIQSYQFSGVYRSIILRELKKAGLPEELSWLPLVESGFKICALSRARALGLWQFIPSTGYKFGLNRDEWIDERMDVEKSTMAAISYLKELHGMFGDWLTVLAAYNCGEGRVLKVISRQHLNFLDRFWDLYHQLPYETARYVPRFLATIQIIKNPGKYGFDLEGNPEKEISYKIVKSTKSMKLQDIALRIGTTEETLNILNSELRHKITPDREYSLKIPDQLEEKFYSAIDEIPQCEKPRIIIAEVKAKRITIFHRVKRGESLSSIARKYRTSVRSIKAYNQSVRKKGIVAGTKLVIPVGRYNNRYAGAQNNAYRTGKVANYKVKKGDTLATIARKFDTSVEDIRKINKIKINSLKSGQIIRIKTTKYGGLRKIAQNE
jgi:membrane-bound lytic murein transglycosylase D